VYMCVELAINKLGECMTMWGEHEQGSCILATENDRKWGIKVAVCQQSHNCCRKFMVLHSWH